MSIGFSIEIVEIFDAGEALDHGPGYRRFQVTVGYGSEGLKMIEVVRAPEDDRPVTVDDIG